MIRTERVVNYIDKLLCLIQNHKYIIDSNVCDFLTHNQWNDLLKQDMRTELSKLNYETLHNLPNHVIGVCECHTIRDEIRETEIVGIGEKNHIHKRDAFSCHKSELYSSSKTNHNDSASTHTSCPTCDSHKDKNSAISLNTLDKFICDVKSCSLGNMKILSDISEILTKHNCVRKQKHELMSPKKGHEISIMSDCCLSLYQQHDLNLIIDLGSGKGYLDSDLSLNHGLPVLGVESSMTNTHGARQRHDKLASLNSRGVVSNTRNDGKFHSVSKVIDENTDIAELVKPFVTESDRPARILLTGLHACGELTASTLKLFVKSENVMCMCVVGCCYHLLNSSGADGREKSGEDYSVDNSFPMSEHLQSKHFTLSHAALNLAAQSLAKISASPQLPGESFFNRALLQLILRDIAGVAELPRDTKLRNIERRSTSTYEYVMKAFTKLCLPVDQLTPDLIATYADRHHEDRIKLSALCQLRYLLAPSIEAVILLDRYLWLLQQEQVDEVHLVKLFDENTSPRCHALISSKLPKVTPSFSSLKTCLVNH